MKEQWSVWWAMVWHEDGTSKIRPVTIVSDNEGECECLVLRITSQVKSKRNAYEIKCWKEIGLKKRSMIILEQATIKYNDFGEYIGMLDPLDIYGLTESLRHGSYGSIFQ